MYVRLFLVGASIEAMSHAAHLGTYLSPFYHVLEVVLTSKDAESAI